MTSGAPNYEVVEFNGRNWKIVGWSPHWSPYFAARELFESAKEVPSLRHGSVEKFKIEGKRLLLDYLSCSAVISEDVYSINGVRPTAQIGLDKTTVTYTYSGLNIELSYTGGLLIADVSSWGQHYDPLCDSKEAHELIFERGTLVQSYSLTENLSELRAMRDSAWEDQFEKDDAAEAEINEHFSRFNWK